MAPNEHSNNLQSFCPVEGNSCWRYFSKTISDRDLKLLLMSLVYSEYIIIYTNQNDTCVDPDVQAENI